MAATMNGMAAHGGVRPYGATFLVFLDYCKPSVRLAALMELATIYIFTHDSIGLGEDGPTHQPIEQLAMLRGIPGHGDVAPGRLGRDGRSVAHGDQPRRRPDHADPHATEAAGARAHAPTR